MTEVFRAAVDLQALCVAQGWKFCFIGGIALQRWGEVRETTDVDLTLLTGFGREEPYIETLLKTFEPRLANAAEFALSRRVLLLRAPSPGPPDIKYAHCVHDTLKCSIRYFGVGSVDWTLAVGCIEATEPWKR